MFREARRDLLLDGLVIASGAGALLSGLYYADVAPPAVSLLLLAAVLACGALWIAMRRGALEGPAAGVPFALCAAAAWFCSNSSLGLGMIWIAAIVVARCLGLLAVSVYAALIVLAGSAAHVVLGAGPEQVLVEGVGATLFALTGALLAMVLHDSESAERALRLANAELGERAGAERELVLAQERERTARGLHDGLGHRLTAIGLSLEFAERARDRSPERAWEEIGVAREAVRDALDDMRRLVRAMHPIDAGVVAGSQSFTAIAEVFRSSGIDVRVRVAGPLDALPQAQTLMLVKFVQEGLTNVVRHTDAGRVDLSVTAGEDLVEAAIEDDGGPAGPAPVVAGFGLRSLRTRSEELGGRLEYAAGERGFRIGIRLPLREEARS